MNTASHQTATAMSDTAKGPEGDERQTIGYRGDLTPEQSWDLLSTSKNSRLIDVRSEAEWSFVGICDLSGLGKSPLLVPLLHFPGMTRNENFPGNIEAALAEQGLGKDVELLFLCRSGQRSIAAARVMTELGYEKCFNILEGFEGGLDPQNHRGQTNGWKARGLPWVQQ